MGRKFELVCKNGHRRTYHNTYINTKGYKICRECQQTLYKRTYVSRKKPVTECKRGHPREVYGAKNSNGSVRCKACARMLYDARQAILTAPRTTALHKYQTKLGRRVERLLAITGMRSMRSSAVSGPMVA